MQNIGQYHIAAFSKTSTLHQPKIFVESIRSTFFKFKDLFYTTSTSTSTTTTTTTTTPATTTTTTTTGNR